MVVEEGRIVEVRRANPSAPLNEEDRDFGEAILLPGLVNVHTHLDYTVMRGLLEDLPFFDWIRELTARSKSLTEEDWVGSATLGAAEAVAGGVTTIGDCTPTGAALLGAKALGLRGTVYQEVFSTDETEPVEAVVSELALKVAALRWSATGTRLRVGISPHSPYTVRPAALRAVAEYARSEKLPVCIHAAESQPEAELVRCGTGEIAERLTARGITWMETPPETTVVRYLESLGALGPQTLLVHGVQMAATDRDIILRTGAAWAHCPKSNAKLGNGIVALRLLQGSQSRPVRVGLGSDSVASNNTMDLFEEMRFAVLAQRARSRRINALCAKDVVEMATIGGACSLGLEGKIGSLEPGKEADLIAVNLNGLHALPCYDPYQALVYASGARDVLFTMVAGEPLYDDRTGFRDLDMAGLARSVGEAARKMREWTPPE